MKRTFSLLLSMLALPCLCGAGMAETEQREVGEQPKVLVAYFSCTGNTRAIAEQTAALTGATLYEIVPEQPYTDADLNYRNKSSRSTMEMGDNAARPVIAGSVEAMEGYDIVFLGYPIWWGDAPRIISTFLESYDFAGKTIVPFCTSGSSGIGASAKRLHALCDDTTVWLDGARFAAGTSADRIGKWITGLGLEGVGITNFP